MISIGGGPLHYLLDAYHTELGCCNTTYWTGLDCMLKSLQDTRELTKCFVDKTFSETHQSRQTAVLDVCVLSEDVGEPHYGGHLLGWTPSKQLYLETPRHNSSYWGEETTRATIFRCRRGLVNLGHLGDPHKLGCRAGGSNFLTTNSHSLR